MAENGTNGDRLDSWKAIAAYLNRDERTVRRWEAKGLPVRRVPGHRGQSVFAFKSEIDRWLTLAPNQPSTDAADDEQPIANGRNARGRLALAGGVFVLVCATATFAWRTLSTADDAPAQVVMTPTAVVGLTGAGIERWRYEFDSAVRVEPPQERQRNPIESLPDQATVLVGTGLRITRAEAVESGELLLLGSRGDVRHRFAFEGALTFGAGEAYMDPWGITDFRVDDPQTGQRIAVAAHHYEWWPSMIAVLDAQLRRSGTFVNAGWLERVHWLSPERLLVAGFSESRQGGVVALLDPDRLDGQSPEMPGSRFFCSGCGAGRPVRYIVMPRSEVNRASASRFNRARLQLVGNRITVRTIEALVGETDAADAVYEFDAALDIIRAAFSDRYWEVHETLEAQDKLDHSREQCPDRNGPREIAVWEPASGWRTIPIN